MRERAPFYCRHCAFHSTISSRTSILLMEFVREFGTINKNDVAIAGGKGASLGEMVRAGIPVSPGFVITADAFDLYGSTSIPGDVAQGILNAFDALGSEFVAVRSSATAEDSTSASWAGELETYLNTTRENLIENIEKCWQSMYSDRAEAYRTEKGLLDAKISVAVVVQTMVQSEVSGIAFTVHPVTKNPDSMIIEACWGLGEFIVGGVVTPDSYIIEKSTNTLMDQYVSSQETMLVRGSRENAVVDVPTSQRDRAKLTPEQISSLSALCITIERHYGFPCDIEWALANDAFFILQSRPITTL